MALSWISSRGALALPLAGIVLAIANWNARPAAAWAWIAVIATCVVMVSVRSSGDAASVRKFASVTGAVVWGALMMVIPLAVTLAHAYGLIDDADSGRRATMIIIGAYLAATGNALPRMLPPVSSMPCDAARVQAFHRLSGWIWVLGGIGWVTAWLALPMDAAGPVSMALVALAMIVTIVQLLRLRKPRQHAPGLS